MIQHIVLFHLPDGHDPVEVAAVMDGLAALDLPGFVGFEHGPNRDFEGLSARYQHGFICKFTDWTSLQVYADDPRHKALGGRLVSICGGVSGLMVIDLDVPDPT